VRLPARLCGGQRIRCGPCGGGDELAGYRVQRLVRLHQRVLNGGQVLLGGVQGGLGGGSVAYPVVRSARGRSDRFVFMAVMCAAVSVSPVSGRCSTRRERPESSAWLNPVATTDAHPSVSPASKSSLTRGYVEPPVGIEPTTFSLREVRLRVRGCPYNALSGVLEPSVTRVDPPVTHRWLPRWLPRLSTLDIERNVRPWWSGRRSGARSAPACTRKWSPKTSPQRENGRFEVRIIEACSWQLNTS